MTWDGVPWAVDVPEAEHSAAMARVLAYVASAGAEGVAGVGHLAVTATGSMLVEVAAGACSIASRSANSPFEAYAGRLKVAETAGIAATTPSGPRTDLVIARVENPAGSGESWGYPANRAGGPYVFTRVIAGVPPGTTSVQQVRPGDSAITLARIDLPASTSTVLQSHITDLRALLAPRQEQQVFVLSPTVQDDVVNANPNPVTWTNLAPTVRVPSWATRGSLVVRLTGLQHTSSSTAGVVRAKLGSLATASAPYQLGNNAAAELVSTTVGGSFDVRAIAGTQVTLRLEANRASGYSGILRALTTSVAEFDVRFTESLT